ncbi:YqcC family protein [Aliidiomarina sp. Khilg15.8]
MLYQQVNQSLHALQNALQELSKWQSMPPPAKALRSTQPFAVDTLDFHQWLQFIMIPRMQALVDARQPLPSSIAVSPMAVQVYKGDLKRHRELIAILRELDMVLSGEDPMQPNEDA